MCSFYIHAHLNSIIMQGLQYMLPAPTILCNDVINAIQIDNKKLILTYSIFHISVKKQLLGCINCMWHLKTLQQSGASSLCQKINT